MSTNQQIPIEQQPELAPLAHPSVVDPQPIVVGIGASAGGLEALKQFFSAMPPQSGSAFVIVQHLDPHHESRLASVLARTTAMSVMQAQDQMLIAPNCVYVIPPNHYMHMEGNVLRLTPPVDQGVVHMAIDHFFHSLAEARRERAICIIVSGTGSDGTLGLQAIKKAGGIAIVQDVQDAQYNGMPRSAIAAGMVDHVLAIKDMPGLLEQYAQPASAQPTVDRGNGAQLAPHSLARMLALVRTQTSYDFCSYKRSTLNRRIEHRMGLNQIATVHDYEQLLQHDEREVWQLFKDLLISVTSFFRDPQAFKALYASVVKPLVRQQPADKTLRVWVPGCATGEEAYSITILFLEAIALADKPIPLQVFATDIDEQALDIARAGKYPDTIAADISQERRDRFFAYRNGRYSVSKQVRDSVTFATQDLTSDPPFSKLDLVSCRNLLIYLTPPVQNRLLALFHFALNNEGTVFLGSAETVGLQEDLFSPLNKKWRIYRRVTAASTTPPAPALPATSPPLPHPAKTRLVPQHVAYSRQIEHALLDTFIPFAFVFDQQYELEYVHNPPTHTHRYLRVPSGVPTKHVLAMLHHDLHAPFRTATARAKREQTKVTVNATLTDGEPRTVRIAVAPFTHGSANPLFLATFADQESIPNVPPASATAGPDNALVEQLEYELAATREDLQHTVEELEASNEELKAANEEAVLINEALQAANEELETSKEELQSLNEELLIVNNELQDKIIALEASTNDWANLLSSTDVAALFLDTNFCIRQFTPAASEIFKLREGDVGRSLADIVAAFVDEDLFVHAQHVLDTLQPATHEVRDATDHWYLRRILPYRTTNNHIDGVVLTFSDINEIKQAETALRESEERFRTTLADSPVTVFTQDIDLRYTWMYNPAGSNTVEGVIGKQDTDILERPEDAARLIALKSRVLETGRGLREEIELQLDGAAQAYDVTVEPLHALDGRLTGITCVVTDITQRKQDERVRIQLLEGEQAARAAAESAVLVRDNFLSLASHELKTPLTVLYGNIQLLRRRTIDTDTLSDRDRQTIQIIANQSVRIERLINLMLDVSRIDAGQLRLTCEPLDLVALTRRMVDEIQIESALPVDVQKHRFVLDMQATMIIIDADVIRLEQVLQNILWNAVKYSPQGGEIAVTVARDDDMAFVAVRDHGIGIPAEAQEHIFERFYRATNADERNISGTGIGLYVVREIARLHGGNVAVKSEIGQGSTFTLHLPLLPTR